MGRKSKADGAIERLEADWAHLHYNIDFMDLSHGVIEGVDARALQIVGETAGMTGDQMVGHVIRLVNEYWNRRQLPTKYGNVPFSKFDRENWNSPLPDEFTKMSEILEIILYYKFIRAAKMGLVFEALSGGRGKVVAIGHSGVTEYPSGKKKTIEEALSDEEPDAEN